MEYKSGTKIKQDFIYKLFYLVAKGLYTAGRLLHLTYNEINIVVYYMVIPLTWLALLDKYFGFHYLKIIFVISIIVFFISCRKFSELSDRFFEKSVDFLNYFARFGSNYILSSVLICVLVPILIYALLICLIVFK